MKFLGIVDSLEGQSVCLFSDTDAQTPDQALINFNAQYSASGQLMIKCYYRHGGWRPGAGRKGVYAEKTKAHKIPLTMSLFFDEFLIAVADILDLLDEYEELALASPTSPRFDKLRHLLNQSKESRDTIRKVVNAFRGK